MRNSVLLLLLAFACPVAGRAAEAPTVILTSDSEHYRQALEGFSEAWGSTLTVIAAAAPLPKGARAFVTFGGRAAARAWPKDAVVVACLAPLLLSVEDDAVTSVSILPEPAQVITRAAALVPGLGVLRVLWSSDASRADAEALAAAGTGRGVTVLLERVSPPSSLPVVLRELKGKTDGLWLMPDPALVSADNIAVLRDYAAVKKIPFLSATEGLAERGATATIAASFRDMGRAAAASLRARLDGTAGPEVSHPARVIVTVNAAAARDLGLRSESADKVLP